MIAVCDYGIGNLRSAEKALQSLGAPARLLADPEAVAGARGVVVPGVGAFGPCAAAFEDSGLAQAARQAAAAGTPLLGICIGFQLLYEASAESPGARGLGLFSGSVQPLSEKVKRPQMQWNALRRRRPSLLLEGLGEAPWVYFVHSYAPPVGQETVATCDYGGEVAVAVERDNLFGVQFHPEKSSRVGLAILANFLRRCLGP
jgi:glutamine amidotransferase